MTPLRSRRQMGIRQQYRLPDGGMNIPQQCLQLWPMRQMLIGHHLDRSAPWSDLPPLCDGLGCDWKDVIQAGRKA